jgi:RNA recognition motif-containing protein
MFLIFELCLHILIS